MQIKGKLEPFLHPSIKKQPKRHSSAPPIMTRVLTARIKQFDFPTPSNAGKPLQPAALSSERPRSHDTPSSYLLHPWCSPPLLPFQETAGCLEASAILHIFQILNDLRCAAQREDCT